MPTYYVGPGGNDANSGLTWALRKLTLNGAEDVPVIAGDTVYVGPGVYRETLNVDVSGGAGTEIVYIGDVTGENTDGVGGIVRITGSDNDQTPVRARCIRPDAKHYRVFRGFFMDFCTGPIMFCTNSCQHWTVEDCAMENAGNNLIFLNGNTTIDWNILRCLFRGGINNSVIYFNANSQDVDSRITNCVMTGGVTHGIGIRNGGLTVKNCTIEGRDNAIRMIANPPVGFVPNVVNNCIFVFNLVGIRAAAVGQIIEDFNNFYGNNADRANVNVGANSQTYASLFQPPILHAGIGQISGYKMPWWFDELSEWSQVRAITGANEPTVDLRGLIRPATASKNSWGPTQFMEMEREIGTVRTGVSSMVLLDAGINQMFIPITAEEITVEVYVQREANYAGVNPQMIIKQPGQADRVTLDAGAAGAWNLLTDTFTPAALPPYVIVEFVSNNTAVAGAYSTFFDDLEVS